FFLLVLRRAPSSTPFPYTTLFRSEAVLALPPIAQCDDTAALLAAVPPPADPDTRRRADEVRQELAELEGVALAGRYKDGLTRAIDRKSTRLNSSHVKISYAVFCLK